MSWVTIIWSMLASACLTLAVVQLLVWCKRRTAWSNLIFSIAAVATAGVAASELWMMRAETPSQFATALRWFHVPGWVVIVSLVGFVRLHMRAGRPWLGWTICALRTLALLLNFLVGQNLNYREITRLRHIPFLGESVSVAEGVSNPCMLVGQLGVLLLLVFVADAAITVWRRGDRRRALLTGGSIGFLALAAIVQPLLLFWQIVDWPITVSFFFLGIVVAIGYELSHEALRAAQLSDDLRDSEARMTLAAEAAGFGVWMWDIGRKEIWGSEKWLQLFGFVPGEEVSIGKITQRIHPDDRQVVERATRRALKDRVDYVGEYRVVLPDGSLRWIAGRGRLFLDKHGKPSRMLGASIDITERKRAEEALRESEARFRSIADAAPVLIWMAGTDKLCNFFNKVWLDFTGRTLEQELGNGWAEGVHPEDLAGCVRNYVESFDARRPFTMEYRLRRHDGEYRWISDNGVPRYDAERNFLGYIGSCMDLTERKRAEEALKESEERFRQVAEAAAEFIWEVDAEGLYTYVSPPVEKALGYSPEELVGKKHFYDLFDPSAREALKAAASQALAARQSFQDFQNPNVSKSGKIVYLETSGAPMLDASGHLVGYRGAAADITGRKQADRELRESEARYRDLFDGAIEGVYRTSLEGKSLMCNPALARMLGYSSAEEVASTVEDSARQVWADPEERSRFVRLLAEQGTVRGYECQFKRKDGTKIWVSLNSQAIRGPDKQVAYFQGFIEDLTERKQAELQLVQQRSELAHVARVSTIGQLASALAHELNQPLGAILRNAEAGELFLRDPSPDLDEVRAILADIRKDDQRAGEVIERIRGLMKRREFDRRRLDLNLLAAEVITLVRPDAEMRRVRLALETAPALPSVHGDRVQLQQVVLNLLLNAMDAVNDNPPAGRLVAVRARPVGETVEVAVSDNGHGISADKLPRVFEPFFTSKPNGLGMGLAISRSIIEAHGGRLWAENNPDNGATFRVWLPAAEEKEGRGQ